MIPRLAAFLRLSRPHFLAGGVALYALGALVARYEGAEIRWPIYLAGQLVVTAVQLMTHFLNEYWDFETDRLATQRTLFSGGSGALADGRLARATARRAGFACLLVSLGAMAGLIFGFRIGGGAMLILAAALFGAFFYSSPPLALAGSGFGGMISAAVVGLLVPLLGYTLQTGRTSSGLILSALPLTILAWGMTTIFEFPDVEADRAMGKRTLVVRAGYPRSAALVILAMLSPFGLFGGLASAGFPVAAAGATLPLALVVGDLVRRLGRGQPVRWGYLTFGAVSLFALTAALEAVGYYLAA